MVSVFYDKIVKLLHSFLSQFGFGNPNILHICIYCIYTMQCIYRGLILVLVMREISTFSSRRTDLSLSQRWHQMWAAIQITLQVIFVISHQVLMVYPIVSNHLWIS